MLHRLKSCRYAKLYSLPKLSNFLKSKNTFYLNSINTLMNSQIRLTLKVSAYLEACSKLFEKGFLSHDRVMNMDSEVLKSISEGYNFFTTWMDQILENGMNKIHVVIVVHILNRSYF